MRSLLLFEFAFILYCSTAGVFLLLAPWSPAWSQLITHFEIPELRLLQLPIVRSAVSGFGLVHLVWGAHDLLQFAARDPRK